MEYRSKVPPVCQLESQSQHRFEDKLVEQESQVCRERREQLLAPGKQKQPVGYAQREQAMHRRHQQPEPFPVDSLDPCGGGKSATGMSKMAGGMGARQT